MVKDVVTHYLDKELEKREYRFVRYADDGNIYVKKRRQAAIIA